MDTVLRRARTLAPDPGRVARYARYIAVGAFGTALYYLALVLLVEALLVGVLASTSISFVLVVAINYLLHRMWTFRSPVAHSQAFIPFVAMSVAGFGINTAVMALGLAAGIHYLLVQAVAIAIVVAWNYIFTTRIFSQPIEPARSSTKGFSDDPT